MCHNLNLIQFPIISRLSTDHISGKMLNGFSLSIQPNAVPTIYFAIIYHNKSNLFFVIPTHVL